jgi:hypothetical protein
LSSLPGIEVHGEDVEEELKMDVREDIRAAGITTIEFFTWDRGP